MDKRKRYENPKDLINETYNADAFPVIERRINPLVMPESMVRDIDAYDSRHFYDEAWAKVINNKDSSIH